MKLKDSNAEIIAIKDQAEHRTISTAVNKVDDQKHRLELIEIAQGNNYQQLKDILPKLNEQATAALYPIYSAHC